jgi:UDP-glucose 4-epimerase
MDCAIADDRAINIGQGLNVSVNRIAQMVGGERVYLPPRAGEAGQTLADFGEAEHVLGWRAQVSTEAGIQ